LLKNRNDYLLGVTRCNALQRHYFSDDIVHIIEVRHTHYMATPTFTHPLSMMTTPLEHGL